jgi:hypothetical protein
MTSAHKADGTDSRYDSLKFAADNKIMLPGGTMDGLKMLPKFEYSKE